MIILGVDPGTAATGYGVVQKTPKRLRVLDYGTIITQPRQTAEQRLKKIYTGIVSVLKKYRPDVLVVEKLYFFKNLKTAMPVSEAKGVILLAAAQRNIWVQQYTPLEAKMAVCGYGRADKQQVQKMLKVILGLKKLPQPDDAADGLALAICYFYQHRNQKRVLT